jgi:LmbE family N-acetylglucosaminyl deacetylase
MKMIEKTKPKATEQPRVSGITIRVPSDNNIRQNVMFVGAHPDDIELGCLGTIMRYIEKEGKTVRCIIASDGEAGLGSLSHQYSRVNEAIKALTGAGVSEGSIRFLNKPDTDLRGSYNDILRSVENACKEWKIGRIFLHTHKDRHQDHRVIYEVTMGAARFVPDQLTYESNSSTLTCFTPTHYVDISNWIGKKIDLLQHHESQFKQKRTYLDVPTILAQARSHGAHSKQPGVTAAEVFEIERMVEV